VNFFSIFSEKALPKKTFALKCFTDGRNSAVKREKSGHFIPPRLTGKCRVLRAAAQ
jgi:hypothetical protein